ncbi:hypothetical protein NBRC10513_004187 [Rhodotorula toruloides]|uniref:BY PROTMAP: gi/647402238/emb/CDR48520.1/ RHTO0S18e01860g1_1 [Rhodosporidium toruloides] n=2 Tax=Rhodotorula toruloides TaxID=5286 RepID=A0A0K3CCZ8_RHOTO
MSQTHTTDSGTASVACSERSGTSRTDTLFSHTTSEATLVLVRYEGKDYLFSLPDTKPATFVKEIEHHFKLSPEDALLPIERALTNARWAVVHENAWGRQFEAIKDDLPHFRISVRRVEPIAEKDEIIEVAIKTLTGTTYDISINPCATVRALKEPFQKHEGTSPNQQRLIFAGKELKDEKTLPECGIEDGGVLHFVLRMRGDKPVIYLFPPTPLDSTSVTVTITPAWHFSALYPVADPVKGAQGGTSASWTVSAQPDGSLVDLASGLELKYLFWEAEAYRTNSNTPSDLAFDPSNPSLDASNGCALPFATFLAHLDKTLASLSLHTAARNDFITYWLSHFTRIRNAGQHIGFRFLAQSDYERAARLNVDPKPDVVTRVFLLFKGVDAVEASEWRKPDKVDWLKEVGVEVDKVKDESLFRVLEWGGMEVV